MLDNFYTDTYGYLEDWVVDRVRTQHGRIAIVGLAGAGQHSLVNSLYGWNVVMTATQNQQDYGLIQLVDLPSDASDAATILFRLESADAIIFVLDGMKGLSREAFGWLARLRNLEAALLVVITRADRIPAERLTKAQKILELRLARPIVALTTSDKNMVREQCITLLLKVCPDLAVPLAAEIPTLRGKVARQIVAQSVLNSVSHSLESGEIAYLHDMQQQSTQMLRRIAAVYGYVGTARVKERLLLSLVLRQATRRGLPALTKIQWLQPWMQNGILMGVVTLVIGYAAILSYGATLPGWLHHLNPQSWRRPDASVDTQ